jgi:hypothetical protein
LPAGVRTSATESWGTFEYELTNRTDQDRRARILAFYEGQPDAQYGADIWIPARSRLTSWFLVGPAPAQEKNSSREIQYLLYDLSEGKEQLLLPTTEERTRNRGVLYRKRAPTTIIVTDNQLPTPPGDGELPRPDSPTVEAHTLVRVARSVSLLEDPVSILRPGAIPPLPEACAGIDHLVLASNRLASDRAGLQTVRRWVEQGGTVWVLLDLVDPEAIAPLLGDALDFEIVDRVRLTHFQLEMQQTGEMGTLTPEPAQTHERPVDFVRVLLPAQEKVRYTINGWPVWFTRQMGRGKVVFTALGGRGWHRPRKSSERVPPAGVYPTDALVALWQQIIQPPPDSVLPDSAFQATLNDDIGYAIVNRQTVTVIFAGFLGGLLALGLLLRRSRRPEWIGWLGPVAALLTTGSFIALGESSRRAVPPTVALGQIAFPGQDGRGVALRGQLNVYRPSSGTAQLGAEQGGLFELSMAGIQGRSQRMLRTDTEAWHWDNLTLPAGVRSGSFRSTAAVYPPIGWVAQFGPNGIEGKLTGGPFQDLSDVLLTTPSARHLAVSLRPDGTFTAGPEDVLPIGQYLAGGLLSDQQQRRKQLYADLLKRSPGQRVEIGTNLLVWAKPLDLHFSLVPEARQVGTALLVLPLRLEPPPPGSRVTIPGPLLAPMRELDNRLVRLTPESRETVLMPLRFQLPSSVLPLRVEKARVLARIEGPGRRVTFSGQHNGKTVEIHHVDNPVDPIRVEITDDRLLEVDEAGGLHLSVGIEELKRPEQEEQSVPWKIQYLELEVVGRTQE